MYPYIYSFASADSAIRSCNPDSHKYYVYTKRIFFVAKRRQAYDLNMNHISVKAYFTFAISAY